MPNNQNSQTESAETAVKKLNMWLIILVGFIVIYSVGMLAMIDQKTDRAIQMHPIVMIDPATLAITSPAYTNLIHPSSIYSTNVVMEVVDSKPATNNQKKPMFEQKDSYEVGDFVIVNYFYVEAIVTAKVGSEQYRVMYKDHNHVLQEITLHKRFLLAPTCYNVVSPVSLLVD